MADPAAAGQVLGGLSDEQVLATLRSPPVHTTRGHLVGVLMHAGRFDLVQRAVEMGVVDPEPDHDGWPLLHVAVAEGAVELARYLIFDRGVDPNVKEASMDVTALHFAVSDGHSEAAALSSSTTCRAWT